MKKIVLAGGCFWGVEAFLSGIKGVVETKVGYANGRVANPTYEMVCQQNTGFAEACYVEYDESQLPLEKLLEEYWGIVDPTVLNRQGPDVGSQYRTGIYYTDESDLDIILKSVAEEQKNYEKKIVTEVKPLENFYVAEEYHQKYLQKNPDGYCHIPRELLERH
ncbi:peptide-methionine (S)-S-oxide reductase MsrA [Clostridium thermarum]|uniref:peptide-methionine (S)-S-oxide reductase MsrA n=1 Tax=Clostridium thermarum TaxID=1716543 RepID=UPI0013D1EFDA|nr:peptide-methionine (S)-S-oxide reductase MsrA [Clostridium thermarum]